MNHANVDENKVKLLMVIFTKQLKGQKIFQKAQTKIKNHTNNFF